MADRDALTQMKLKALKKHALECGVDPDKIEDADDEEDVKGAVIALIMERATAGLRAELAEMKLKALKRRAREAGVNAEKIEDADDEADVRGTIIALVLDQQAQRSSPAASTAEEGVPPEAAAIRDELATLKPSALKKRAEQEGIDAVKIKEAKDSDSPKEALIELIVAASVPDSTPNDASLQALRDELSGLKPSDLEERALAAGVDEDQIDDAVDGDTPKETLIELIVAAGAATAGAASALHNPAHPVFRALAAQQLEIHVDKLLALGVKHVQDLGQLSEADISSLSMSKLDRGKFLSAFVSATPHMGPPTADAIAAGGFIFENGQHCMLSYDWSVQEEVIAVRQHFQKLGIPTCESSALSVCEAGGTMNLSDSHFYCLLLVTHATELLHVHNISRDGRGRRHAEQHLRQHGSRVRSTQKHFGRIATDVII